MLYLLMCLALSCFALDTQQLLLEIVTMPKKVANLSQDEWLKQIRHNFIIEGDPGCPDCGLWDGKTADESKMVVALADCIKRMIQFPDRSLALKWCLIGDDDTYFALSNVVPLLRQYDPEKPYFLGFGCPGTWVRNKYRLVCRVNSPSRGFLYGYANADIAYGGKGMMVSIGALRLLGTEGVAKCRRELVCGNMDGRVAHCLFNNGTGVQLTDISALEATYGILTLHRTSPLESFRKEQSRTLNSSEPFCFARTKKSLPYKSGVMLLGLPSPWLTNMQQTISAFVNNNGLKLFHPLDIDLKNSKTALLPLEHLKPFHLARIDVYIDFPFDYQSRNIPKIEAQLTRWQRYTKYNVRTLRKHHGYLPLTQNETFEREEALETSGYKGKVGPILPWVLYMQITRAQVVILPLEDPTLRTVRTYFEEHVDLLLQQKFELLFPPTINEALTNQTLLNYWRRLQGLSPMNAQFNMYGGLTQSIADLSLPGRQQNPVYHPFWFETKIPHPPHKHQLELDMGINIGSTFAELVPIDLAHYDECMVLLEVILGWQNLPNFAISSSLEALYEPYLSKIAPENMEALIKMNSLDAILYRRAQNFLEVLRTVYQHPRSLLQKIVRERKQNMASALLSNDMSLTRENDSQPTNINNQNKVDNDPLENNKTKALVSPPIGKASRSQIAPHKTFIFSDECRAVFRLPSHQHTDTREYNGVLVEGVKTLTSKPILRFGTKEDSWVQIPRSSDYQSSFSHREKVAFQRPSKWTAERQSPVTGTVLISDRYRFIYIAVYKAASRTLLNLILRPEIEARYINSFELSAEQKKYFTFSFIRDPLTRFISAYKTLVHRIKIEDPALVENTTHTESDVIVTFHRAVREPDRLHTFIAETLENPRGGVLVVGMQHMFTQAFFFTSTDSIGLPTLAREAGVVGLDFIGHVEKLDRDWEAIEALLGLPPVPKPIQVRNKEDDAFLAPNETSYHLPVTRSDLTVAEVQIICDFYKQDYICFGFPFPAECSSLSASNASLSASNASLSAAKPTDLSSLAPSSSLSSNTTTNTPPPRRLDIHKPILSDSLGIAWFGLVFLFLVAAGVIVFLRRKKVFLLAKPS